MIKRVESSQVEFKQSVCAEHNKRLLLSPTLKEATFISESRMTVK